MEQTNLTAKEVSSLNMFADAYASCTDDVKRRLRLLDVMTNLDPKIGCGPLVIALHHVRTIGPLPPVELIAVLRDSSDRAVLVFAEALDASLRCRAAIAQRRKQWGK